jgi:hypothetical protein
MPISRECLICKSKFFVKPSALLRGRGLYCSLSCAASISAKNRNQSGERNPKWKGGISKLDRTKIKQQYRKNNPIKYAAHVAMWNAIRSGVLVRAPCEKCGETNVEGHHDDYSKPLSVRWLCKKHHIEHHWK